MSQAQAIALTTPVGRIVQGDLYAPQEKDMDGNPLVIKNGPNKGQPTKRWYFALAIPKDPSGRHWAHESWGKIIWERGHADFPGGQAQRPDFAWKIEDGDSIIPNKRGRKPVEQEGFKGCWVLRLSSGFMPKTYDATGSKVLEAGAIKPGYFVQVYLTVAGNEDGSRNPGVYLNPSMVAMSAYGPEIQYGPDPKAAGFGQNAQLPAGASLTPPPAAAFPPASGTAPAPAPATAPPPVSAPTAAPAPAPAAIHTPAATHTAMAPPPPAAAPAPAVARQMTAKANGVTYEAYRASGWTDEQLVAHGMMTA